MFLDKRRNFFQERIANHFSSGSGLQWPQTLPSILKDLAVYVTDWSGLEELSQCLDSLAMQAVFRSLFYKNHHVSLRYFYGPCYHSHSSVTLMQFSSHHSCELGRLYSTEPESPTGHATVQTTELSFLPKSDCC